MDNFTITPENIKKYSNGNGPIIVVDDDESQLMLVKACYEKSTKQNELICLKDSQELLSFMDEVEESPVLMPALVLLDINMPRTSGFDALKEIRSRKRFKEVPVIIMFTTSNAASDKEKAKELDANAFFSKPSRLAEYIDFFNSI